MRSRRKESLSLPVFQLCGIAVHPQELTRLRLNCQALIAAHQNSGDGLLDGLPHFAVHPTADFLRRPLKVPFERSGGKLNQG